MNWTFLKSSFSEIDARRVVESSAPIPRHIALIVRYYDEAIAWSTGVLGFTLVAEE